VSAIENLKSNLAEHLPVHLLGRLESLYPKLAPAPILPPGTMLAEFGAPILDLPSLDVLSARVSECSFKFFSDPEDYLASVRAKEYVSWIAPRGDIYRIFFNAYSRKIYVDLNEKRWNEVHSQLEDEILFCDILRTLIWVLTCEVELFEAREAENNTDRAVTSEVTEIIIP
jgi:hypothetical protein